MVKELRTFNLKSYLSDFHFSEYLRFDFSHLRADFIGGVTSAIVALPLALGFGLLSYNGNPEGAVAGLYGAIFTGILASLFGGTQQQITGPTGGMTVVLTQVYIQYGGVEALLAACIIAGLFQIGFGFLKFGKYVNLVPYPVTIGFTNGIAILIFTQQFKTFNTAPVIALFTMAIIFIIPKINKNLPKSLIGLILGSLAAYFFSSIDFFRITATSLTTFSVADAIKVIGDIPSSFKIPNLPHIEWATWKHVLPAGFTISLLGAIESLLASTVADNASNTRHHSNRELIGQGIANFVAPFFGGVAGTGAIVRTMVNIRSGGRTKFSGIIHGAILIVVMLFLGGLASHIPLAALAGVLMMTAIGMFELEPIQLIPKAPAADSAVLLITTIITVLTDLITAVEVGMVMAAFLFVHRMSEMGVDTLMGEGKGSIIDDETRKKLPHNKIAVYDVEGPLFFGAARSFVDALERNFDVNIVILDMENVPIIDTTGAVAIENIVHRLHHDNKRLLLVGIRPRVRAVLYNLDVTKKIGIGNFIPTLQEAIDYAFSISSGKKESKHLGNFISDRLIMLNIEAETKSDLLDMMIGQAIKAGIVKDESEFSRSILERENETPTVIGHGVAVPHARSGGENNAVVFLFARLRNELVYDSNSGEKVKFIFLVSTGSNDKEYLNLLRMIAINIKNEKIYQRLLNAHDATEVHHIFSEVKM